MRGHVKPHNALTLFRNQQSMLKKLPENPNLKCSKWCWPVLFMRNRNCTLWPRRFTGNPWKMSLYRYLKRLNEPAIIIIQLSMIRLTLFEIQHEF